jgi:hypothetical protein
LRCNLWELAHAQVIDDHNGDIRAIGEHSFARALERRVGDLLEQRVGLAVTR